MSPNIPLIGWYPDADPTTPGVVTEVQNLLPTVRGYAPDYGLVVAANTAATLPSQCLGGATVRPGTSIPVLMLATANALYAYAGALRNVTRASPAYADANPSAAWRFEAFGEDVFAVQQDNVLQRTTNPYTGVLMANVSGAPGAGTIVSQSNFLMLGNTFGSASSAWPYVDGWWCSELGDATGWTPDVATQCARGRLTQTPGGIVRMIAFQDNIIAFKDSSMLRGTYVGTPTIWAWSVIATDIGAAGHDCVVQADGVLYWIGPNGFYRFNGGTTQRISSAPWEWFKADSGPYTNRSIARAVWDPVRRVVRWHYPSATTYDNTCPRCIVYHVDTDRWGFTTSTAEWAMALPFEYVPTVTDAAIHYTNDVAATVDSVSHAVKAYTGLHEASVLVTGDYGDDDIVSANMRARLRFLRKPSSASGNHYHRMNLGDPLTLSSSVLSTDGKYDFSHAARWHRLSFNMAGAHEVTGMSVAVGAAGKR